MTPTTPNIIRLAESDPELSQTSWKKIRSTWWTVVIFALAMAWVESAVVFYLRTMIDRIIPYQPDPLPISGSRLGPAELIRELATLIMLGTVGWLAGKYWQTRLGYTLLAFGLWDMAYYLWLIPLTHWPASLTDWDILFLFPLPWWGPVWSPVSIAVLMVTFGTVVAFGETEQKPLWPSRRTLIPAGVGIFLALYVFMADAIQLVLGGEGNLNHQLRHLLPTWFNWPLFFVAWILMATPVAEVLVRHSANLRRSRPSNP